MPLQRGANGNLLRHTSSTNSGAVGQLASECCCADCCQFVQRYNVLCVGGCVDGFYKQGRDGVVNVGHGADFIDLNLNVGVLVCTRVKTDLEGALRGYVCIETYPSPPVDGDGDIIPYTFDNDPQTGIRDKWSDVTKSVKVGDPFLNQDQNGDNQCTEISGTIKQVPGGIGGDCLLQFDFFGQQNFGTCPPTAPDQFPDDIDDFIESGSEICSPCIRSGCFGAGIGTSARAFLRCRYRITLQGLLDQPGATPPIDDALINVADIFDFRRCIFGAGVGLVYEKDFSNPVNGGLRSLRLLTSQNEGWQMDLTIRTDGFGANSTFVRVGKSPENASICLPDTGLNLAEYTEVLSVSGAGSFQILSPGTVSQV